MLKSTNQKNKNKPPAGYKPVGRDVHELATANILSEAMNKEELATSDSERAKPLSPK